jgi:UDP-N-acetylmuramoyl-L-alanyl-D-glutamate--2,6-diaminopimelate ligase
LQTGIVNADDPSWHYFADEMPNVVSYGLNNGEVKAEKVRTTNRGSDFTMRYQDMKLQLHINIPGEFNVYNALAAAATGAVVGLTDKQIAEGLASFTGVPGRMEVIEAGQPFAVLVDYAVTPDALEKALLALRHTTKGSIHLVFGATGDRDKTKRPTMGNVAARYADHLYLTDDETYTEDPEAIREAVYKGVVAAKGKAKAKVIADRREAIMAAFKAAKAGDTVLLTGIGHETVRNMGGKEIPWDERKVARELLNAR